VKKFHTRL